jgi:hypothetical protein
VLDGVSESAGFKKSPAAVILFGLSLWCLEMQLLVQRRPWLRGEREKGKVEGQERFLSRASGVPFHL